MADILHDILVARHQGSPSPSTTSPSQPGAGATRAGRADAATLSYLVHLAAQSPLALETSEPQRLAQSSHSLILSIQALSKRSHRAVIESATRHQSLRHALPTFAASAAELRTAVPKLDSEALHFATTYSKAGENANDALVRRKKALLLARNVERLVDVLELPALLSSAISASPPNYASALDLNGHVRRLHAVYPASRLVVAVSDQAEDVTRRMAADLLSSLQAPGLKLAASLRTVGWLRRLVPDFNREMVGGHDCSDRALGFAFLLCRLATLGTTLDALQPLRELADEERARQAAVPGNAPSWSGGQQTERYLKRYVEIFREQSFGIVSIFKSVFPASSSTVLGTEKDIADPLQPLPSPLAGFPLYLVQMLLETLREYLPCVRDQASRESILTQVQYCAGSLSRLGGDFGMLLSAVCADETGPGGEPEWVEIVKRHRLLAGRLETVIGDYRGLNS